MHILFYGTILSPDAKQIREGSKRLGEEAAVGGDDTDIAAEGSTPDQGQRGHDLLFAAHDAGEHGGVVLELHVENLAQFI